MGTYPARRAPWSPDEEWADIPGYWGTYWVSSHGRIKSRPRSGPSGGILVQRPFTKGRYAAVTLSLLSVRKLGLRVHRVVAAAFIGPCPVGLEVCHNDGNPMNPRVDNLRYDTHAANMLDRRMHNNQWTVLHGEQIWSARLIHAEVIAIRERYAAGGVSQRVLAGEYGVDQSCISDIIRRKSWAHID